MKKLSIMILMAASMLAACDNNNNNTSTTTNPADPDYVSTHGESNEAGEMVIDRTSNSEELAEGETLSEGPEAAEARARKAMASEEERVAYWTVEEESIEATEESVRSHLDLLDKNFSRMETDVAHIKTGTYNPEGRLGRNAQKKLNEVEARINEAKQQTQQARTRFQAGNHEGAADKIKAANKKLADAREKYMDAIERETGVEMEDEVVSTEAKQ